MNLCASCKYSQASQVQSGALDCSKLSIVLVFRLPHVGCKQYEYEPGAAA